MADTETFDVGKLVSMDWKMGVAVTSSRCKRLNAPFVVVQLRTQNASGEVSTNSLEMTIPEFQNFSKRIKEAAACMT
ncbi:COMM domain containing 6 [Pelomyxa schiedti]|nr:COMM domain containing 6 [Pelomyxa schiedti]